MRLGLHTLLISRFFLFCYRVLHKATETSPGEMHFLRNGNNQILKFPLYVPYLKFKLNIMLIEK